MTKPHIQYSFNSGEWAPALYARVDMQKYHSGAALLRNYFVDYRGGASSRPGTKYVVQAKGYTTQVRLIPFQASSSIGFALEFGNNYIRPIRQGAPVLEGGVTITGITKANPAVVSAVNSYSNGDIIYVHSVGGMTQVNGRYFQVGSAGAGSFALLDLLGNNINSTGYSTYTSGGAASRLYQIASPYPSTALPLLKFVQNVSQLIITHSDYPPYVLTYTNPTSWAITAATFGSGLAAPSGVAVSTTLGAGNVNYAYVVTAVNVAGEEGPPSSLTALASATDLRTNAGTNTVTWSPVTGAVTYNVYKAELRYNNPVPSGSALGYVGTVTATSFIDSNIAPDFTLTPPIPQNPFSGAGVASVSVTSGGSYTTTPTVTFSAGTITATGSAVLQASAATVSAGGTKYHAGDTINLPGGVVVRVDSVSGALAVTAVTVIATGITASVPGNPVGQISTSGTGIGATFNVTWTVTSISISNPGTGYGAPPTISFSPAGASATATLGAASAGNPSVPGLFQQRLIMAAQTLDPESFQASQPGSLFNFDIRNPLQPDDAISAALVSGQLNDIKSMVSMPSGLVMFTSSGAWLVNGGSPSAAISPISGDLVAHAQAYAGANDMPPITANFDILYVQSKGSVVRDLQYNFYTNVYAGVDISTLSSHLFFGYTLLEWAWAAEPYKLVYAVRNDGVMLTLTYSKEQELIGWAHYDMDNAIYKSVCCITENTQFGNVDAVYIVVQRIVSGVSVQYIERFVDRIFPNGVLDAWSVDSAIQYRGTATASFTGGEHLAGLEVTGVADGFVIDPFTMPTNGFFTLDEAASIVTIGRAFSPQLQTLPLDLGEPTVQGKRKKITGVTLLVQQTLNLEIGSDEDNLVAMKDLILGNLNGPANAFNTDLVTGMARTVIDPKWTVPGQYFINQPDPYPVTILGVVPEVVVGDS